MSGDGLDFLVGRFTGEGVAEYPTMGQQVRYAQEMVVRRTEDGVLEHRSHSWNPVDGSPMADESGWWRVVPAAGGGSAEVQLLLSHSIGLLELYLGSVVDGRVELASDVVVRAPGTHEVSAGRRMYGGVGDGVAYVVEMAAEGHPLLPHLSARLDREPGPAG